MGITKGKTSLRRKCVEFAMSISHSRRDVQCVFVNMSFEFRRKVKVEDICLAIDGIWIVFKRMRLD